MSGGAHMDNGAARLSCRFTVDYIHCNATFCTHATLQDWIYPVKMHANLLACLHSQTQHCRDQRSAKKPAHIGLDWFAHSKPGLCHSVKACITQLIHFMDVPEHTAPSCCKCRMHLQKSRMFARRENCSSGSGRTDTQCYPVSVHR